MMLLIDNHGNTGSIIRILDKFHVPVVVKDQKALFNNINFKKVKGIILSGGGLYLDKKIYLNSVRADISLLVDSNAPILGICLGHEIICEVFGGEVLKLKKAANFPKLRVNILDKSKIFKGLPDVINVYENHNRYIKNLPDLFKLTATSRKDSIESFFHKEKPIFGVQFHPEESGEVGEKIIKNFVGICCM